MRKYSYDACGNAIVQTPGNIIPPQITGQPVDQVVATGHTSTFSVVIAEARAATFQWKFNGTDIPGEVGDSLLLNNVTAVNEGQYSVVVTNSAGSVTSAPAALMLDRDGDGLPDSWEMAHFGSTTSQRSAGDADDDGLSNLDELLDRTDPTSATSLQPRLIAYSNVGGSVTITPMKRSYSLGETVTLTATPFAPSLFVGWMGDRLDSTGNPGTLTMTGSKTVWARFASAVPLLPGLVAFWRGEADAADLIGGHHGSFFLGGNITGPSITAAGKVGGAFSFDGTVHVRVPESPALKLSRFTAEAWVFPTVQDGNHRSVIASGSSVIDDNAWSMGVIGGRPRFSSKHGSREVLDAPTAIPLNQWTHLAISFDGTTMRLYVDGALVNSKGGLRELVYEAGIPVTIGSNWVANASSAHFKGHIDEVAIYNRALSSDEVAAVYNADLAGKHFRQPYFTSPPQLPDVALGFSYTQQLTTILGTAPITFSLSSGALPPGMILSSTGLVSGIPSVLGSFDFTVVATDAGGLSNELLCLLQVLQPILLPADVVAWWRREPITSSVVPDILGGHDGSFYVGNTVTSPVYTAEGTVGRALAFDGTLHIRVPDAATLRRSEMTAEAWVFLTVRNERHQSVIAKGASTTHDDTWWMGVFNGKPQFWSKHFGSGSLNLEAPSAIALNQWTHLAISFDGTTKRLNVNGVPVASQGGLGELVYDLAAVPVTIGSDWANSAPDAMINGRLNDVRLYRRALSTAEIFSLAGGGPAGKTTVGPYINSPSQLPFAVVSEAYAQTFVSDRGTAPVSFALSAGSALPFGTLASTGRFSGIPTTTGSFLFSVRATDAAGSFYDQLCTLHVLDRVSAPAGLVSWWKAESNVQDSVGINHGVLRNGSAFSGGKVGQAFSFDGNDDFIEILDAPTLRPLSITLEAWVAFESTSGIRVLFAKPVGAGVSDSYALWLDSGALKGAVGHSLAIGPILSAPFSPAPGLWYHVAYTFDDNTKQQTLYIDGSQVAIGATTQSIGYDTQPLFLGRDTENGMPAFFLQGRIDEATIYDRALSAGQVAAIYNSGPAGKQEP